FHRVFRQSWPAVPEDLAPSSRSHSRFPGALAAIRRSRTLRPAEVPDIFFSGCEPVHLLSFLASCNPAGLDRPAPRLLKDAGLPPRTGAIQPNIHSPPATMHAAGVFPRHHR